MNHNKKKRYIIKERSMKGKAKVCCLLAHKVCWKAGIPPFLHLPIKLMIWEEKKRRKIVKPTGVSLRHTRPLYCCSLMATWRELKKKTHPISPFIFYLLMLESSACQSPLPRVFEADRGERERETEIKYKERERWVNSYRAVPRHWKW